MGMSRWFDATSLAREALTVEEQIQFSERARLAGVAVQAGRNVRRRCWNVVVQGQGRRTVLHGEGSLAAVIAGAIEDHGALAA